MNYKFGTIEIKFSENYDSKLERDSYRYETRLLGCFLMFYEPSLTGIVQRFVEKESQNGGSHFRRHGQQCAQTL